MMMRVSLFAVAVVWLLAACPCAMADASDLTLKEMRKVLAKLGVECRGCAEKQDYVDRLNQVERDRGSSVDVAALLTDGENDESQKQPASADPTRRADKTKAKGTDGDKGAANVKGTAGNSGAGGSGKAKAKSDTSKAKDTKAKKDTKEAPDGKKGKEKTAKDDGKEKERPTVRSRQLSDLTVGVPEAIVCINIACFVLWSMRYPRRVLSHFLMPSEAAARRLRLWTVFTPALIHTSLLPLVHTCFTILNWGLPLVSYMGNAAFALTYVAGASAGTLAGMVQRVLRGQSLWAVQPGGAAAVTALMAAFACIFWNQMLSWNGVPMKPWQLVLVHVCIDTFLHGMDPGLVVSHAAGGVAGLAAAHALGHPLFAFR